MEYPRILVISNNSFSNTDSNGRTLGNLFLGWPKDKLAQFCISTDGPNFELCDNYYCITDKDALKAFLHFRKAQGKRLKPLEEKTVTGSRGEGKKTLLMMMARNLIWGAKRWKSKSFKKWVDEFDPEVILMLFSDSSFILDLGTTLSKELNIPLVMFNTEGYYFFKSNYFRTKTIWDWLLFPIYQGLYRKHVRKTMARVEYSMYLNQLLQTDYDKEFGGPSCVLYTLSTINTDHRAFCDGSPVFSYIGNLTFNRPKALMEVADVLQSINTSFKLDIYGKARDKATENELLNHPGISYKGFVNYDEVQRVILNSDVLFHAESLDMNRVDSLKYGFSTKIADSISSGACFVLYAPSSIACSQYIIMTHAGWFAESKNDLKKCLDEIIIDKKKRAEVLKKAQDIAFLNHNQSKNCNTFRNIIIECVENNQRRINNK